MTSLSNSRPQGDLHRERTPAGLLAGKLQQWCCCPRHNMGRPNPVPPAAKEDRISKAEVMDEVSLKMEVMAEVTMTMHGHASTASHSGRAYA
jgi:hypothetical protein